MKMIASKTLALVLVALAANPALAAPTPIQPAMNTVALPGILPEQTIAQALSCSPRKTCKQIPNCQAAFWYYQNCSWGGRLDGDNDGVPCESICR